MPKGKSTALDANLVVTATAQANALKATLIQIANTSVHNTAGLRALTKTGKPLAKVARTVAITYPEILTGRFDVEDYDNKLDFDTQTEPLLSLLKDTLDTFDKRCFDNSADIEYQKRKIYNALTAAAEEDNQYSYYAEKMATEYAGQGKRTEKGEKVTATVPNT